MYNSVVFVKLRFIVLLGSSILFPLCLSAQEASPVGKWKAVAETDQGTMNFQLNVVKAGDALAGSLVSDEANSKHEFKKIAQQGQTLNLEFDFEFDNQPLTIKIETKIEKEKQIGEWTAYDTAGNQVSTGRISAERLKENKLAGKWNVTADTENGERGYQWTFTEKDGAYSGSMINDDDGSEREIKKIEFKEGKLTFVVDLEIDSQPLSIKVATKLADKKQDGTWAIHDANGSEFATGDLTAVKESEAASLEGEWNTVAVLPDGQKLESVLTLKNENEKLTGTLQGTSTTSKLENIKREGEEVRIEFTMEGPSGPRDVVIEATLESKNALTGEWILLSDSGEEEAFGDWSANRKE